MTQMTDDELMARILDTPETAKIAEALGLEPADYAVRVLHYIKNPNADPQLQIMDAAAEKEAGMPSQAECLNYLEKLDSGEIPVEGEHATTRFAGFDEDEKSAASLTGGRVPKKGAAPAPPMPKVPGEETAAPPKRK